MSICQCWQYVSKSRRKFKWAHGGVTSAAAWHFCFGGCSNRQGQKAPVLLNIGSWFDSCFPFSIIFHPHLGWLAPSFNMFHAETVRGWPKPLWCFGRRDNISLVAVSEMVDRLGLGPPSRALTQKDHVHPCCSTVFLRATSKQGVFEIPRNTPI